MEEVRTRTLVVPDIRGEDRYLRITWHPATSTVVFSHWSGSLCTASTPVSLPEASRVIDLLVGALRGAASDASPRPMAPQADKSRISRLFDLRRRLQDEWRRRLAR